MSDSANISSGNIRNGFVREGNTDRSCKAQVKTFDFFQVDDLPV